MYRALVLTTIVAIVALPQLAAEAQQRAAKVLVDTVDIREISDTQAVIGQLVATRRATVATRIAGVVEQVHFNVGDRIKKDQTLVKLDDSRIAIEKRAAEASVGVAKAGITVAEARLKLAEQAFQRQAALRKSTAFSRSRYDDLKQATVQSRSEHAQARAQLETARSSLDLADYGLTYSTVKAPFDGIIIARQHNPAST